VAVLMAAVLMLISLSGCAPKAGGPAQSADSQTPVTAAKTVRGALPGLQVVPVSTLRKSDQQAVAAWTAAGQPPAQLPTLKPGTYKPLIDGHVLEANESVGSDNGIAVSVIGVQFDPAGTQLLADYTAAHVGESLAVVLDGQVVTAADVRESITQGQLQITGAQETMDLVAKNIIPAK